MASMVADQNWEYVDGQDLSENFELSPRNHNLLMSLLDEVEMEECDDERLTKVIQSLQDELDCADQYASWGSHDLVDCQSSIDGSYGREFPSIAPYDDLDLRWMDVEIVDHHGQEMIDGGVNEFGLVKSNISPLEGQEDFWHGTDATLI